MDLQSILRHFRTDGEPVSCRPFGNGHINKTYLAVCGDGKEYILQRINRVAFHHPEQLIENIDAVTDFISHKDSGLECIRLVMSDQGHKFFVDDEGEYWRVYAFLSDGVCLEMPRTRRDFYEAAEAFGAFQHALADFPASTLHETIPHFHDTVDRIRQLRDSVREDPLGRADSVREETQFILSREEELGTLCRMQSRGELPLRVTHNDTKLNNVLLDAETGRARSVLDLDTVMPGLSAYDFGDAIRFGASTAAEDEKDLGKVTIDLELYRAFLEGYLDACGAELTEREIEALPMGAKVMTAEVGMRFLKDYIDGDVYFKTSYPEQNLDRCRTQLKLVREMERKWDDMQSILRETAARR